jgi:GNAT superfamily N-acetyltransferase
MELLNVTFSPLAEEQIDPLETVPWSAGLPAKHRARFARQQLGEVVYLIAWTAQIPIGHMLIHWTGPQHEPIASRLAGCAEIEDFVVRPDLRSRGIGRRMLAVAEDLARQRGLRRLGLGVGLGNPRARALYEAVGYHDSGLGVYVVRWQYIGRDGHTHWDQESCIYLVKELTPEPSGAGTQV